MTRYAQILAGAAAVAVTSTFAMAQDRAPISWWYENASPANQDYLKALVEKAFNDANADQQLTIDFRGSELDKQLRVAMLRS